MWFIERICVEKYGVKHLLTRRQGVRSQSTSCLRSCRKAKKSIAFIMPCFGHGLVNDDNLTSSSGHREKQ